MTRTSILLTVFVLVGIAVGSQSLHPAFASTMTLDGTSCTTITGSWDSSTNTCIINGPTYTGTNYLTHTSDELVIPSGTSLVILNPNYNYYVNYGTLTNHGTIQVSDPGYMLGFQNFGTVNNYGTINISNTGFGTGIANNGPFNNYGIITISTNGMGSEGHGLDNYGIITNSGIITLANTGNSAGLKNFDSPAGTIINSGTITVNCGATYVGTIPIGTPLNNVSCVTDTTPPVITPVITGTLGNNGWYTSDVSVSWTVTDPESSITSPACTTTNIITDTASQTVTCTATSAGGTSSNSVTIKRDATAPTITAPSSITLTSSTPASPPLGAPTVSDNLDSSPVVTNNAPASFASGTTTTVTWTAKDLAGNSASDTQQVTIQTPAQAITGLTNTINGMSLPTGEQTSLGATLKNIDTSSPSSCGKLNAFVSKVNNDLSHGKLTISQANTLLSQANAIKAAIGCK